jgi:membrane protein implicated in regulation of membrane protease activity
VSQSAIWAAIWFAAAAAFGIGEIMVAGSFFLFPFAIGALGAAISALFLPPVVSWLVFGVLSAVTFVGLRPMARRLEQNAPSSLGIGANRLIGSEGVVVSPLPATAGDSGMIKVGVEEWRAQTRPGVVAASGTLVRVVEVQGTRLVVEPVGDGDITF